jgi:hypothetical protein
VEGARALALAAVASACYDPRAAGSEIDAKAVDSAGGADGAGGPDGVTSIDAPCVAPVGPYAHDFDVDGVPPTGTDFYETGTGSTVAVSGGELRIALDASASTAYGGLYSTSTFDFRNATLIVRLVDPPDRVSEEAYLGIQNAALEFIGINLTSPTLYFGRRGSFSNEYWTDTDRWWRVHDDGVVVRIAVSPDGIAWRELAYVSRPTWIATAEIDVGAGIEGLIGVADQVAFDDLNRPPCP